MFEGGLMVNDTVLGVGLGILVAILGLIYWRLIVCGIKIDALESLSRSLLDSPVEIDQDSLIDRVLDAVHESMGQMEMPTAQDHIMGGVAQMAQMWLMKKMGFSPGFGANIDQEPLIEAPGLDTDA